MTITLHGLNETPAGEYGDVFAAIGEAHPTNSDVLILSGSHAYGLNHAESDIDIRGIYYTHSADYLGLRKVRTSFDPNATYDYTAHELTEFVRLMTKCNPNIIELVLIMQDDNIDWSYRKQYMDVAQFINQIFPHCLGSGQIRAAYGGFAQGQMKRMSSYEIGDPRRAKLIRHGFRVLEQGIQLLGGLTPAIRLDEKAIELLLQYEASNYTDVMQAFSLKLEILDSRGSDLPEEADEALVERMLIDFRIQRDFR